MNAFETKVINDKWKLIAFLLLLNTIYVFIPSSTFAKEVGSFFKILGRVDHLKANKQPAIAAKINGMAEQGDGVHTNEASRTQIHTIDNSDIFIAPKSKIVLDHHVFEGLPIKDNLVLEVWKGLIRGIVNIKPENKFYIKTFTVMGGVRGTDFYVLIGKNFTDVFVKDGHVYVQGYKTSRFSLIGRAHAGGEHSELGLEAVSQGALIGRGGTVIGPLQACRIIVGSPPAEVISLPIEYFARLERLMRDGLPDQMRESSNPKQLLEMIVPSTP